MRKIEEEFEREMLKKIDRSKKQRVLRERECDKSNGEEQENLKERKFERGCAEERKSERP